MHSGCSFIVYLFSYDTGFCYQDNGNKFTIQMKAIPKFSRHLIGGDVNEVADNDLNQILVARLDDEFNIWAELTDSCSAKLMIRFFDNFPH